jgi:hypothetical protein
VTTQPGAAEIPFPPSGETPPPAGAQAGAPPAGGRPQAGEFGGIRGLNGGQGTRGLRQALGCEDPDTYKLTPEERAACLERFRQRASAAPDLGLPIPGRKQAAFDHVVACQAYRQKVGTMPASAEKFEGASVAGLDPGPSLRECAPGDR